MKLKFLYFHFKFPICNRRFFGKFGFFHEMEMEVEVMVELVVEVEYEVGVEWR